MMIKGSRYRAWTRKSMEFGAPSAGISAGPPKTPFGDNLSVIVPHTKGRYADTRSES